jgi:hypothetical protein
MHSLMREGNVCLEPVHSARASIVGFALTVLYLVTTYLGTDTVFGPLVVYHVELIIAILVLHISLPSLPGSLLLKTPQSLALAGLALAVFLSVLATGWAGGAVQAFQSFIPNAFAYFLVCLHCNSRRKFKFIVFLLLLVCLFVIVRGSIELRSIVPPEKPAESSTVEGDYLVGQQNQAGEWIYRLRGKNLVNDPNDFAQLVVCLVPLVFIFWRPKKRLWNAVCVLLPVSALIYGAFLTHSRGFLLAFLAMAIVAGRRRIGTVPAFILAGLMFFAASATNFTGGRDISLDAGSGRMDLWGGGMEALKSHPLFGVGFGRLPDVMGLTAHNSIVVCAAELGLFGLFFWCLFLLPTLRDAFAMASPVQSQEGDATPPRDPLSPQGKRMTQDFNQEEITRVAQLIILSFTGFLVAGFFLSRAFVMTMFLIGGMTEVVYEMARRRGMISARWPLVRILPYTGGFATAMVLVVYITLRVTNFMH